jgi:hypothetical protein
LPATTAATGSETGYEAVQVRGHATIADHLTESRA